MTSSPVLPPGFRKTIQRELCRIEAQHRCHVLFAVGSGSRAWGFPSPDSDWDIRFVYAVPPEGVITLSPGRDVIEETLEGDLDVVGWRSDKAIRLLLNGNCTLREWIASPVVYRGDWIPAFAALAGGTPARAAAHWHYRALMTSIWDHYIEGRATFSLKRYLYVIRPALALLWLHQHPEGTPPMDMGALLAGVAIPEAARAALAELLARKAKASEIGDGPAIPALHALAGQALALPPIEEQREPDAATLARAEVLYRSGVKAAGEFLGKGC